MLQITHNDDGKQKWKSHTVNLVDKTEYGLEDYLCTHIAGYGAIYEEAFEEFKNKLLTEFERLKATIEVLDALSPIEVDCFGKEITK
ncbi:MAG: hypothetical protein AB9836_04575 [Aminipila sp.]